MNLYRPMLGLFWLKPGGLGLLFLPLLSWMAASVCLADPALPTVTFPTRSLALELAEPCAPAEAAGLAVTDPTTDKSFAFPLELVEGREVIWKIWLRGHAAGLWLQCLVDSGGPIRRTRVALTPETLDAGGAVTIPWRLELGQGGGNGIVRLTLLKEGGSAHQTWTLATLPVTVQATPAPATMEAVRLAEVFGKKAVRLNTKFRLGPGGKVSLPLPPSLKGVPIRRIGVVSSVAWISWRERPQFGQVLAELLAVSNDDSCREYSLRLGPDTLPMDPDFSERLGLSRRNAAKVCTVIPGKGQSRPRQTYSAQWVVAPEAVLREITLKHSWRAGVLQVEEVVVIPD